MAEDEGPGVRRHFASSDGVDVDGAILHAALDAGERTGITAELEMPMDLTTSGPRDFARDGLEFGKVRWWPIAGIGSGVLGSLDPGRVRRCNRSVLAPIKIRSGSGLGRHRHDDGGRGHHERDDGRQGQLLKSRMREKGRCHLGTYP